MTMRRIALGTAVVLLAGSLFPMRARAQFDLDIFQAILGTITGSIGGALNSINQIRTAALQTEQNVLWPIALINQQRIFITSIVSSYRGWMNQVFSLPVNSALLPTPKSLESTFLSGSSGQITNLSRMYASTYGVQPVSGAAPTANLQIMDIEDAVAKDATAQSMAADQSTTTILQTAQTIENESQTTAPGTADMIVAEARSAELASLAMQHKLLAYELREAAMELGHRGAILKQSVTGMQNLNQQILNQLGGSQ